MYKSEVSKHRAVWCQNVRFVVDENEEVIATIKIKVSLDEADELIKSISHKTFQEARKNYWRINEDGSIWAQSVLWLFCWAKTGMGSKKTAQVSQEIFDKIFTFSYNFFNSRVPHNYARENRYLNKNIQEEVEEMVSE